MSKDNAVGLQDFAGFNVRPDNKLWIFSTKTRDELFPYSPEKEKTGFVSPEKEKTGFVSPEKERKAYVFGYTWFDARSGALAALHLSLDSVQGKQVENLAETLLEAGNPLVFVTAPGAFQIFKTLRRMSGKEAQAFNPAYDADEGPDSQTTTMQALQERSESIESIEILSEEIMLSENTTPRGAAISLIEQDGKILCVWNRRYNGWTLPGGMIEDGENPPIAQARELAEETGLVTHRALWKWSGPNNTAQPNRASMVHLFLVTSWSGAPTEMEHGCPIAWKTREDFIAQSPFGEFYAKVFHTLPDLFQKPSFNRRTAGVTVREEQISTMSSTDYASRYPHEMGDENESDETESDRSAFMCAEDKDENEESESAGPLESIVAEEITKPSSMPRLESKPSISGIDKLVTIGRCSGSYDISIAGHAGDALFLEKKNAEKIANEIRQTIYGACATELAAKYMQGCSDANQLQKTKLRTEYLQACNNINARVIYLSQIIDNQEIGPVVNASVFNLLISEIKLLMEKRVDADINASTANGQEEISAKGSSAK